MRLTEGPHRMFRDDTLESTDGENAPSRRRPNLKTYEQLRTLHPEKGHLRHFSIDMWVMVA